MNEQIKTTTVDQLPEAASLDGLYVFGYASKNAVGKRSVKAPITLLKGNQGDIPTIGANGNWWISGKDTGFPARGQDGDVTTEQLNQTIEEYMKNPYEEYALQMFINFESDIDPSGLLRIYRTAGGKTVNYLSYIGNRQPQKNSVNLSAIDSAYLNLGKELRDVDTTFYFNDLKGIQVWNTLKINNLVFSSISSIDTLYIDSCSFNNLNVNGLLGLKEFRVMSCTSPIFNLFLRTLFALEKVNASKNDNLVEVRLFSSLLTEISIEDSPKAKITFQWVGTLTNLVTLNVKGSATTRAELMDIEEIWTSRTGKDTGVLRLSQSLYDTLTAEDRAKFTTKNITFDIVA